MHSWRMDRGWFALAFVIALAAPGCNGTVSVADRADDVVTDPEAPLVFKFDDKARVWLNGRWVEVFNEQAVCRNYVRKRSEEYRRLCEEYGIALLECVDGKTMQQYLPTEVVFEPGPKTRRGVLDQFGRLCMEYGFRKFRIDWSQKEPAPGEEQPIPEPQ